MGEAVERQGKLQGEQTSNRVNEDRLHTVSMRLDLRAFNAGFINENQVDLVAVH